MVDLEPAPAVGLYRPYRVMQLLVHWPLYLRDGDRPRPKTLIRGRRQRTYEAGFVPAAIEYGDLGRCVYQLTEEEQGIIKLYWQELLSLWEIARQFHRDDHAIRAQVYAATVKLLELMVNGEDMEGYYRIWREKGHNRRHQR